MGTGGVRTHLERVEEEWEEEIDDQGQHPSVKTVSKCLGNLEWVDEKGWGEEGKRQCSEQRLETYALSAAMSKMWEKRSPAMVFDLSILMIESSYEGCWLLIFDAWYILVWWLAC